VIRTERAEMCQFSFREVSEAQYIIKGSTAQGQGQGQRTGRPGLALSSAHSGTHIR